MKRTIIGQQAVVVLIVFVTLFGLKGYKNDVYAASTAVTHVLKQGMQNDEVVTLQERLKELNFFNTDVTGYFGEITKKSVMSFQESKGLGVDGVVGPQTVDALFSQQQQRPVGAATVVTHVLKQGMQNDEVVTLQERLKELNFFSTDVTGYFGEITKKSVMSFQESKGLGVDGVVGPQTVDALFSQQQQRPVGATAVSRGDTARQNILVPWFNGAEDIFAVGTEAVVTDVDTGISFRVERTGGTNHSDTETLSKEDTALLKKIYGGEWSWERRAVIVTIGNRKIAASMTGMPHAGRDDKPAREVVSNRSDGYGTGINYDSIKGNGMDGHFDIHFLGSRTHATNRVDEQHQAMVMKAARSYMN